ncbi:MAG TPA: DHH family phosphoesterase [Bacteroidales bacterium]|nr:DHH family phosphoesterase [Bacteroidales bacterium]HOH22666.1 DHH family phosphoesterase [Bacteroidales bacterium]HPB57973.1 DHH family phosphoesterase [Bacteroidales bacterium]HPZ03862.1 DHH family phosphoesterase [Bacteroidales bacterium]HQB75405.1 DHH family phosphoesterase [Bacteroidales bacterium]
MLTERQKADLILQLSGNKKIAVTTHYNPDGDALGSSLAISLLMRAKGHHVDVVVPNVFPSYLTWMPNSDEIVIAATEFDKAREIIESADILFIADMNAAHRAGRELESIVKNTGAYKIMIDHHPNPICEAGLLYSTIESTSASELVFRFFKELYPDAPLSLEYANCIYTGMITDTGSLSYSCNRPLIYEILKELMEIGVDGELIHRLVYDNYSESRLRLLGVALKNMVVMRDYGTTYLFLTRDDLFENDYKIGDTEGFVNYGLSLSCAQFTAFFTEKRNRIRISFRSKDQFDVNQFASRYFDGGGHKNAAAAYHYDTLENTILYFQEVVRNHPELKKFKV